MLKPGSYRKIYRDLKFFDRNKDVITAAVVVKQATNNMPIWKKLAVFFRALFA